MRNSPCFVFACLAAAYLVINPVVAVAVHGKEADSSYLAEVTGSAQMLRSESHHATEAHPDGDDRIVISPDKDSNADDDKDSNANHAAAKQQGKLKVELYYESRCPDCVLFINNSLAPIWQNKDLNPHIELTMNPYGNAMTVPISQISEGYFFWHPERKTGWDYVHICQHGGEECFANTIQACAISKLPQEKHMELILCMESLPEWGIEKASYECMEKLSVDKNKIRSCANGPEGNKILAELGKKTQQVPGRTGTPWLMVNGQHLENPTNLLKTVCAHVGPESSTSCKPFATEKGAKKSKKEEDDGDEFQVFNKLNNVDKNLVIMPPPKRI
jgi:hypothetical protein